MDTKEREALITGGAAEFEVGLRSKARRFEAARAERKSAVSAIEVIRGESRKLLDEILKRVRAEMSNGSEARWRGNRNGGYRSSGEC
jgi:hypothetical protein